MHFHRALVVGDDLEGACRDLAAEIRAAAGPAPLDVAVVFASTRFGLQIDRLPVLLHEALGVRALVGCSAAAVVDERTKVAGRHAITVLAGCMPGCEVAATAIAPADLPGPDAPPSAWRGLLPASGQPLRGLVVLAEPFHADVRALMAGLDYAFPDVPKLGGLASGSRHPEGHAVFAGRTMLRSGAVVLSLRGDVAMDTVVAQGCRPFGRSGTVTRAERTHLIAIDGQPAGEFVAEQLRGLEADEREVAIASPLLVGIAPSAFAKANDHFLVRSIIGMDERRRFVVDEPLPVGRSLRLLMRDPDARSRELHRALGERTGAAASGALLFQCLGRDADDHAEFARLLPEVPLAGFHCNGEIGPAGDATHLHTLTSAFALFRPRSRR